MIQSLLGLKIYLKNILINKLNLKSNNDQTIKFFKNLKFNKIK